MLALIGLAAQFRLKMCIIFYLKKKQHLDINNMAGKGDKPRPVDKKKYDENFDRIFSKKSYKKQKKEDAN